MKKKQSEQVEFEDLASTEALLEGQMSAMTGGAAGSTTHTLTPQQQDMAAAQQYGHEAFTLTQAGHLNQAAQAFEAQAADLNNGGDSEDAARAFDQAAGDLVKTGHLQEAGEAYNQEGQVLNAAESYQQAASVFGEAATQFTQSQHSQEAGQAYYSQGESEANVGGPAGYSTAAQSFAEAATAFGNAGHQVEASNAQQAYAVELHQMGDTSSTLQSEAVFNATQVPPGEELMKLTATTEHCDESIGGEMQIATADSQSGHYNQAAQAYQQAALLESLDNDSAAAATDLDREGAALNLAGHHQQAAVTYNDAGTVFDQAGQQMEQEGHNFQAAQLFDAAAREFTGGKENVSAYTALAQEGAAFMAVGDSVDGDQAYAKDLQLMEHNGQTSQTAAGTLASVLELQNVPLNELPNPDMTSPIVSDMQSKAHTDITSELTAGGVLNEAVSMTNQMEGTLAQTAEKVMMDTLTSAVETGNTGVMENVQAAAQLDEAQAQPGLGLRGGFQQVAQNAATDATQSQQTSSSSSSSDDSLGSVILNGIEGFIDDVIS